MTRRTPRSARRLVAAAVAALAVAAPLAPGVASAQQAGPTLREAAAGRIAVGAAVATEPFLAGEEPYLETLRTHYDSVVAENFSKWDYLQPRRGEFQFEAMDRLVAFAEENGMAVRGHPLVWYSQLPGWVQEITDEAEAREVLRTHIQTVMTRYRGRIDQYDVVNEAFDDGGNRRPPAQSFWERVIGPEYVDLAFRWAAEADPDAQLFYNDYDTEELGGKSDAVHALVSDLVARGVPIDGVGVQYHVQQDWAVTDAARENVNRIGALGLQFAITELDVAIPQPTTPQGEADQARVYREVAELCLAQAPCTGITTWGFTDRYSWIPAFFPGFGDALPFDEDYAPEPAFVAVRDALLAAGTGTPAAPRLFPPVAADGALELSWAGLPNATGYQVLSGPSPDALTDVLDVGRVTTAVLPGPANGAPVSVAVRAVGPGGTGPASAVATATPVAGPPPAPVLAPVVADDGSATLTWSPVPGAAGYRVLIGSTPGEHWARIDVRDVTSYRIPWLTNGSTYVVAVVAYNGNGDSSPSAEATVVPAPPPPPTLTIPETRAALTIDGVLDEPDWRLDTPVAELTVGVYDNTATAGSAWDDEHLYVAVSVQDDAVVNDSNQDYQDDTVEINVDGNGDRAADYDPDTDRQYFIGAGDTDVTEARGRTRGVRQAQTRVDGGYRVEVAVPWAALGVTAPDAGTVVGLDVAIDDDDDGGRRDGQAVAFGTSNNFRDLSAVALGTLTARTATTRLAVVPLVDCVDRNPDGTYTARFGYRNDNDGRVPLPIGPTRNAIVGPQPDRGQPTEFRRGTRARVFSVDFRAGSVTWLLRGPDGRPRWATATRLSPACPPPVDTVAEVYDDALAPGWTAFTYNATTDLAATAPVRSGARSTAVTLTGPYGLVGFETATPVATTLGTAVEFSVWGGASGPARQLQVRVSGGGVDGAYVPVDAPTGQWTDVRVPIGALGDLERVGVLLVQDRTGAPDTATPFAVDDVRLTATAPAGG